MADLFKAYDPARIRAELAPASLSLLRELTVLDTVDSTNQALQRLPLDAQHGHAIVADQQLSGRGRRGRGWHSPPGWNIYLSLGWNFRQSSGGALTPLPLAVAVMAARALQRIGVPSADIKWPNDLQINGRKVAGILVELRSARPDRALAVVGIGVNVHLPANDMNRLAIEQRWTDVCSHFIEPPGKDLRNRLCGMLLDELLPGLNRFAEEGFAPFADDWSRWDALCGKEVRVFGAEETVSGTARGISDSGGLLVACTTPAGEIDVREFFAGDVSIRRA